MIRKVQRSHLLVVMMAALAPACAHAPAPTPALSSPCASNDSIYSVAQADSVRPFLPARPTQAYPLPPDFHGTAVVHLLVDSRGDVVADSIRVEQVGPESTALLKRTFAAYRFRPATLGGCAVRSWYEIHLKPER